MLLLLLFLVTKILNISDLKEILKILREKYFPQDKWFDFGLELNLPYNQLQAIEKDKKECNACFRECLAEWLKTGRATYKELIDAVRGIGDTAVAAAIEEHLSKK